MIKKITLDWLKEKGACVGGVEWFKKQEKSEPLEGLEALIADNRLSWANWSIVRLMTYKQYVSYAVFSAEQVIGIFEEKYPQDIRPRKAIEAAKECIEDPSVKNKKLAAATYAAADRTRMLLKILNYGMSLLKKVNLGQPIGGK